MVVPPLLTPIVEPVPAGVLTARVARLLDTHPATFVMSTEYTPASVLLTLFSPRFDCVAPLIIKPSFFHWNEGAGDPDAVAVKMTFSLALTV